MIHKYDTHIQLMNALNEKILRIIDGVSIQIRILIKKRVLQIVYDPYDDLIERSPYSYKRRKDDGGFLGSWTSEMRLNDLGNPMGAIFSDAESMELDAEHYVHGSNKKKETSKFFGTDADRRENMDEYIAKGKRYDFYVPENSKNWLGERDNWWTRPRDYYTPTIEELTATELDKFVERGFKKSRLNFVRQPGDDDIIEGNFIF